MKKRLTKVSKMIKNHQTSYRTSIVNGNQNHQVINEDLNGEIAFYIKEICCVLSIDTRL